MSDTPLPVYVDTRKAFCSDASVQGSIAVEKLDRVAACTTDREGQIWAELVFSTDSAGKRRIKGSVEARLLLECQRCLEPVATALEENIDLVLVEDEDAAMQLDKEYEPWVCEDHRLVLADLLDEQLLLALPIVIFHQSGPCAEQPRYRETDQASEQTSESGLTQSNPFAALADLKIERD